MQSLAQPSRFVGIDVSSRRLDIHIAPEAHSFTVPYTRTGLWDLISRLAAYEDLLIVMEATGGLQQEAAMLLAEAGHAVAIVNPRQIRDFARAMGLLAKTDGIDARVIARFAEAVRPESRVSVSREQTLLAALVARRRQLVAMTTAERNRLHRAKDKALRRRITAHLRWLGKEIDQVGAELQRAINALPSWRRVERLLRSVPGVGPVVALTLIASLPELGRLDRQRLASLVGVAPFNRDSGLMRGKRTTWGGRADLRAALYMATLVAAKSNLAIRSFYERLLAAGKPPKVALTACMRKLLIILNAIVRDGTPWQLQTP